jgi:hypothetical protein
VTILGKRITTSQLGCRAVAVGVIMVAVLLVVVATHEEPPASVAGPLARSSSATHDLSGDKVDTSGPGPAVLPPAPAGKAAAQSCAGVDHRPGPPARGGHAPA